MGIRLATLAALLVALFGASCAAPSPSSELERAQFEAAIQTHSIAFAKGELDLEQLGAHVASELLLSVALNGGLEEWAIKSLVAALAAGLLIPIPPTEEVSP